jgi:hypothetical protein
MSSMHISSPPFLALALITIVSIHAAPAGAQSRLRGVVRLGLEHGGDRVLQFKYEDGSSPNVTAGGGLLLTAGGTVGLLTRGAHSVDAQLNLGLKYRTIPAATNQEMNWLRFPLEALLFYRAPQGFRFGGGATVHLRNVMKASGDVLNDRVEFENNPGFLVQAEYVRRNVAFDLRYTVLEYEVARGGAGSVGASSIGVGLSFFFGGAAPRTP